MAGSNCRSPYGERGLKWNGHGNRCDDGRSLSLRRAWIEILTTIPRTIFRWGRSPYGERGLKLHGLDVIFANARRSPYGERGLKFGRPAGHGLDARSLSLRRAWIEILYFCLAKETWSSRSPYGERGLKCQRHARRKHNSRRSPYGERGLKFSHPRVTGCVSRRSPYGERGLKCL